MVTNDGFHFPSKKSFQFIPQPQCFQVSAAKDSIVLLISLPLSWHLHLLRESEPGMQMEQDYYRTWRTVMHLLDDVLTQIADICWAIGITRQMTAMGRLQKVLKETESLSIQFLVNGIEGKFEKGAIEYLEKVKGFLQTQGTVLEEECRLTYATDLKNKDFGREVEVFKVEDLLVHHLRNYDPGYFEHKLSDCLHSSPVAAAVPNFPSFDRIAGNAIYCPTPDELLNPELRKSHHVMLVCGEGVENGIPFWELQESAGLQRGLDGYIRIQKTKLVISHFVEIVGRISRQVQMDYSHDYGCSGSSSSPGGEDMMDFGLGQPST